VFGQIDQLAQESIFTAKMVALNFDEDVAVAENLEKALEELLWKECVRVGQF